jgi:hypothetical protein
LFHIAHQPRHQQLVRFVWEILPACSDHHHQGMHQLVVSYHGLLLLLLLLLLNGRRL